MSAALISIKRGAAIASSAFSINSRRSVGSFLYSEWREQLLHKSQFVDPNWMCAFKIDTLPMVRRMEAQSKLQSELKSDQVKLQSELKSEQAYAFWMQHKKMRDGFGVDFHADKLCGEMKELQKTIRDCFVATSLVGVYILGYAVFAAQKQHKKG